jgi:mycothiol synthase
MGVDEREIMTEKQPQLLMRRPHLQSLPTPVAPPGYRLRHFASTDATSWNRLMDTAFERPMGQSDFSREMATDAPYRPERVKLAVHDSGDVVATASCWRSPQYPEGSAVLHWVGADPAHGGQGLGTAVSVAALHQGLAEGCARAFLLTDDFRVAALKTYLRLDFEPVLTHDSHRRRWQVILEQLCWPEPFAVALTGPLEVFKPQP